MSLRKYILYHPRAYRRSLLVGCGVITLCGVAAPLLPDRAVSQRLNVFAMGALVPASNLPAGLNTARLPGSDGSASMAAVAAATAADVAVPLAVGGDVRGLGREMNALVFGDANWPALNNLWTRESNWNPNSRNRWSGACGIPQALPCSKIGDMSPQGQIRWGLQYIRARYGSPNAALAHERGFGWY